MPTVENRSYCAIFGDIIGSRTIHERRDLQKRILVALELANSHVGAKLVAPFRFIAGDDIRGLLDDESESYTVIKLLQSCIRPYRMRFSVGIGELSTELALDVSSIDGPALHRASSAMLLLKNKKRSLGRTVYYDSDNVARDGILNELVFLVGSIKSSWTEAMYKKAELLSSGLTQMDVAVRLGISHQAVGKSIVGSHYYAVAEGEQLINSLLRASNPDNLHADVATHKGCIYTMQP